MQIVATFENYEELAVFARKISGGKEEVPAIEQQVSAAPLALAEPEPTPVAEPEPVEDSTPEKEAYTLVDVRTKLGQLSKAGKKTQVQELIKSFGVDKLSQIPEEKYGEVMEKAGGL